MPAQNQPTQELTLSEKMKIVQYLSVLPAITIMVFMRRKVGFRLLKPSWLIGMAFFLMFINGLTSIIPFGHPAGELFSDFPWIMLLAAFIQRHRRWRELCAGKRWHTYSSGISYLELLPLPVFLRAHRRIYRFLDPLACFVFAMLFGAYVSQPVARWIAFSSFALFIYEQTLFEKQLDRDLDMLDGLVATEIQSETVEHFAGSQPDLERTLQDTAGIPTGVAFDIHKNIERMRAKQTAEDEKAKAEAFVRQVQQVKVAAAAMPRDASPSGTALLPPPDNMVRDAAEEFAHGTPDSPA